MNLLFVSPTFPPEKGGAESLFGDLTRLCVERGHRVCVVAEAPRPGGSREQHQGAQVFRVRYPRPSRRLRPLLRATAEAASLLRFHQRLLRRERVDAVCVARLDEKARYVLRPRWMRSYRLVVYLHGAELRKFPRESSGFRRLVHRAFAWSDAVVAVSEDLRREAIRFAPAVAGKIVLLPNAVDVTRIRAQAPVRRARPYILYAGRLAAVKNVDLLLRAFAACRERVPETELLVVGTGPDAEELAALARELQLDARAHFLGALEREEVWGLMKSAALVVLPSLAEGHPLVVLEAFAAGTMVLGSDVKGIRDLIRDGVNGVLFESGNPAALAVALVRCLVEGAERAAIEAQIAQQDLSPWDLRARLDRHLRLWAGA